MKDLYTIEPTQFFTATIYQWNSLFEDDKHKDIIIESLQFLTNKKRIEVNAFVIMNNHIHIIMQTLRGFCSSAIQASFMKYTAGQLKRSLMKNNDGSVETYKVNKCEEITSYGRENR